MMTRITKILSRGAAALAIAFSAPLCAEEQASAPTSAAQALAVTTELGGPALWKVADDDTTIYLFGTVHALPADVQWLKGDIARALASSDQLVTEIYVAPGSATEVQQSFMKAGLLPEGESLRDLLSAEQKTTYESAMSKLDLPPETFDQFEPWFAAVNLSLLPMLKAGYSADSGVEKVLEQNATGKPRGNLETVAFQINVFDTLPQLTQINFLIETAGSIDEIAPALDAMVGEWVEGDPEGLAELMNAGLTDPVLADALLYARNKTWAEWIGNRLDTPGTVFVAVGAGHLAGKQSVQDILDGNGIAATRIQ